MGKFETNTHTHEFVISIDTKNTDDMKRVMNEYVSFGYEKVKEIDYHGNVILIYAKEK